LSKHRIPKQPPTLAQKPPKSASPDFDIQIALALQQQGRLDEAERIYLGILQAQPKHFDALHLLGVLYSQRRQYADALTRLDRAARVGPGQYMVFVNRGNVLQALGRLDEALASFAKAIALKPDCPEAFYNRGNTLRDLDRSDEALTNYDRAIELRPTYRDAYSNRGAVLHKLGRWEDAIASYDRAIALRPDAHTHYNRANARKRLAQHAEALADFDRALALQPDHLDALNNRAALLLDLNRFEKALVNYDRIVAIRPLEPVAWYNRAVALRELRRLGDAIASYDRAIALEPRSIEAHRSRGLCHLLAGDLVRGWPDHEYRWLSREFSATRPAIAAAEWRGEALEGKSILVYAEQGLGDALQFCRYLPMLAERAGQVTFLVSSRLLGILHGLSDKVELTSSLDPRRSFDFQSALLTLPMVFGTELATIPCDVPYLAADSGRVARWEAKLAGPGYKIGIAWQGEPGGSVDIGRSIPLKAFQPLAQLAGVRLISLQKRHGLEQLANLPPGMTVDTLSDDFDEGPDAFVDTAAVMRHLDLIVTSDTAIAHLAGAMGRLVFVALRHVPDWRWLMERRDSPWYSTMRLFRQKTAGDWDGVFSDMAVEIGQRLASPA
jgi:tetratricopeptide (TPR) repeat protein